MHTYLDLAPCIYFSTADDGKLLDVNEMLCSKLGYTKQELLGQKEETLFTIATKIFHQTHLFPLLKMQGHAEEIFVTLQSKDKEHLPILFSAERKIINDEPIIAYAGIIVHNRKKFEDELIAAKKEAEAALRENTALVQAKQALQKHTEALEQQMRLVKKQHEELKQLNRVVTHDLQEPLRKLSLFTNLLEGHNEKQNLETIVEKIVRASKQMRSTVNGLQQYVWLTGTLQNITTIDLYAVLRIVKQQLEKENPGVCLLVETEGVSTLQGNREQMQLLLYQLLANAIRFRKEGNEAHVTINTDSLVRNKFQSLENEYEYTEFLKLQIKDDGIGFDPVYTEQVFELFKRLHANSGRGLGLALCKKIVENHQGEIFIDSKEGQGTTVTILLPLFQKQD